MKQYLSSALSKVKPFLSAVFSKVKQFLFSALHDAKKLLSSKPFDVKQFLTSKLFKLLMLFLVLLLVLIIGLSKCSAEPEPTEEALIGIVSIDNLDVHKKPTAGSRVLCQLPVQTEIEILEEKTVKDTTWALIDALELPDGAKTKSGWVDMQHITLASDLIDEAPVEEEPVPVEITMGTITASKLNIRTGPGSEYDAEGAYYKGDRVEILEYKTVDDTIWGRTYQGWVGMGYVRMDGTYTSDSIVSDNPEATKVISDGNTKVLGYGIVTLSELNVRLGPDTIYGKAGSIKIANRYAYYQLQDGWARLEDGWVSTEHFYIEGTATGDAYPAIVTADELNIRTGPHTTYKLVGTYAKDEQIEILAKFGDWGNTAQGWVFLAYVRPFYTTGTGTIANGLNIRKEPNADSEIVGTYTTGDQAVIVEVLGNWGRTEAGWIHLKYVVYDTAETAPETIPATT